MAHTCEIACLAMLRTIAFTQPGVTEHQLFAKMDYESRMKGADFLAYPPVVASGNNANTIHYIANTQVTQPGEMVLMDAGEMGIVRELHLWWIKNVSYVDLGLWTILKVLITK